MEDRINMRISYQRYAFAAAAFLAGGTILKLLSSFAFRKLLSPETVEQWKGPFSFLNDMIFLYGIAFGLFLLMNRNMDKQVPEQHKIGIGKFLLSVLILFGINGFGSLIGSVANRTVMKMTGVSAATGEMVQNLSFDSSVLLRILVLGLLVPIVEEIVFRKVLIDRTAKYGEWAAILTSAIMYALFQGSFSLFFYALIMGGFLAFIYLRTGKVWVVIALHMIMNLFNYVLSFFMAGFANKENLALLEEMTEEYAKTGDAALKQQMEALSAQIKPQLMTYTVWMYVVGGICLAGMIVFIILLFRKKFRLEYAEHDVFQGSRVALINPGMSVYFFVAVAVFVLYYVRLSLG